MFTGLIEDVGTVRSLQRGATECRLTITTGLPVEELVLGESVAVNGACLTVVAVGIADFTADVSPETLQRTNLRDLQPGRRVNLERALQLGGRLGGHIVSGHIDATANLQSRQRSGNAEILQWQMDSPSLRFVVEKGSVAIDGISLTVNQVSDSGFSVAIIPHTLARTTLVDCRPGVVANIETDLLGKYVARLLEGRDDHSEKKSLSLEFLARNGFM
ncbi:riboflavin synthase [Geothermobacter hydrogeniphilus]|uniref:Riboflavin synthase n=1 Tax=Geothermobacter hydrogeniphilus TaxID=1969733 RepID=A0A1X0YER4_9BACT|nr:riboflavin synthase [Geothermobacter hydrogeniphilus]ORJ63573.1 riboflavin synthase [Geothermobacter hydrogeniphilus]